ncbi:MAG: tetratricopeptide repeat protein [Planctomycetes bacterium]|nr:tetratricopeptide repeat protein [Planctomycetota bacterium]
MFEIDDSLRRRRAAAGLFVVLLIVLGVWLRSLYGDFVYDDNLLVKRNPALTELANWPSVVGRGMWSFLDASDAQHLGYWRPLAGTVLLFTNVLGHGSPLAFHWVEVLLHLAATAAAFALALELAGSLPVALLTALLFGLHPAHTESVAWISALNDPLFALFALLALRSWVRWRKGGSQGTPWSAGILLLLSLFSKELGVAVVPLALLYDLARERKPGEALLRARDWLPFAAAGLLWYAGRVAVFGELGAGLGRTTTWFGVGPARLAQLRIELFGGYAWLGLWPVELQLFHPFRPTLPGSDPLYLRALACSAGLVAAIVWAWRSKRRTLAYALAFLPVSILPTLVRVESLGISPLAERYLYLGVFGFALAIAWSAWTWLPRALAIAICLSIGVLYSVKSIERTPFWHDDFTLFRRLHEQTPQVPEAHWGLGRILLERYRTKGAVQDLQEADEVFQSGLELLHRAQGTATKPGDGSIFATVNDHIQTNMGVAWCLLYQGELTGELQNGAEDAFQQIVERYPDSDQAHVGLASAQVQHGKLEDAEKSLRKALSLNERNAEAHHNLGLVLMSTGKIDLAVKEFERALELRPEHLEDQIWLARLALQQGQEPTARDWIARARAAHPESTAPLVVEATLRAQQKDFDGARKLVEQALDRDPDDGEGLLLKGKLCLMRGEQNLAKQALGRACELLPTSFEANYNMGALVASTDADAALPYLVRAYELRTPGPIADALRQSLLAIPFRAARTPVDLAKADLARGDVAGASEWVAIAKTVEPGSGEVQLLAGNLAQRRGALGEAEKELLEACKLLPSSIEARFALAQLYQAQQRTDDERKALEDLLTVAKREGAAALEDEFMRRKARERLEELAGK